MAKPSPNSGNIRKSKLVRDFTCVPNSILRDKRLTFRDRGLLCTLLMLPPDWIIQKTSLQSFSADSRDACIHSFNRLTEAGYVDVIEVREKGKFIGFDYIVSDIPSHENPISENKKKVTINRKIRKKSAPITENQGSAPITENQGLLSTLSSNYTKSIDNCIIPNNEIQQNTNRGGLNFSPSLELSEKVWQELNVSFTDEVKQKWILLCREPKWKKKTENALQICLNRLMSFDNDFSKTLIENAIGGNYQGLVYPNTQKEYEKYLLEKPKQPTFQKPKMLMRDDYATDAEFKEAVRRKNSTN